MADDDHTMDDWVREVFGLDMSGGGSDVGGGGGGALAALEPSLHEAIRMAPSERQTLMVAWETASEHAQAGDQEKADAVAARLKAQIDAILAAGPQTGAAAFGIEPGTVEARRKELETFFQQRIGTAKQQVKSEIGKLAGPLDELVEEPQALVQAIDTQMSGLLDELWSGLNAALGSEDAADVGKAIAVWKDQIAAEPRVVKLRAASEIIGCDLDIDAAIAGLVQDATAKLGA